jgi:hypothetical protein
MSKGLSSHVFPPLRVREVSGAGDEEVFETKASPPAVAGPLIASLRFSNLHVNGRPFVRSRRSRP